MRFSLRRLLYSGALAAFPYQVSAVSFSLIALGRSKAAKFIARHAKPALELFELFVIC